MNFGLITLGTLPSLLRHSLSNGGEGFSPPNRHLRQIAERGGERMNFFQIPDLHVLLTSPETQSSPNFESRKELLLSGSFGI